MIIFGMDPGFTGGIAALDTDTGMLEVVDMPVFDNKQGKKIINTHELHRLLTPQPGTPYMGVIEQVGAMPKQGVSSTFRFGEGYGALQMAVVAHGLTLHYVTPGRWKKHFGLSRDKGVSRSLATQQFPLNAQDFKRVKDDGRAEAAMIALYGQQKLLP